MSRIGGETEVVEVARLLRATAKTLEGRHEQAFPSAELCRDGGRRSRRRGGTPGVRGRGIAKRPAGLGGRLPAPADGRIPRARLRSGAAVPRVRTEARRAADPEEFRRAAFRARATPGPRAGLLVPLQVPPRERLLSEQGRTRPFGAPGARLLWRAVRTPNSGPRGA
jgi:hypothetical protein